MTVRIAHLSDIHFGEKFDIPVWVSVKAAIVAAKPHIIVVSGDMVDSPVPIQLLAAKCELRGLAARANARLIVVPGNHDVYVRGYIRSVRPPSMGNRRRKAGKRWFDRIFFNDDTSEAERMAEHEYGVPPGFSEAYRTPRRRSFGVLGDLRYNVGLTRTFETALPQRPGQAVVKPVGKDGVLVATLDSNKPGQRVGLATGWVDDGELVELGASLKEMGDAHLARVAVVHHHVLPIAVPMKPRWESEPLMVLHNAGVVLSVLAEHHFDLVLHGHWHVPQFARLDLSPVDMAGYPMAVVSAGSAARLGEEPPAGNAFNIVTIADNGRITVETIFYGGAFGPNPDARGARTCAVYREPTATVKLRAHIRAQERHSLECRERSQTFEVTETGDLIIGDQLKGVKTKVADHPHHREHAAFLPADGRLVENSLELVDVQCTPGCRLAVSPDRPAETREASRVGFQVHFPADQGSVDYGLTYACANSVKMTRWEAEERSPCEAGRRPDDWDKEWVSGSVTHPTDVLTLSLKLPPALSAAMPSLKCLRHPSYPAPSIDASGDARLEATPPWAVDGDMSAEEAHAFRFRAADGTWRLEIHQPIVGYRYKIAWALPGDAPLRPVEAAVLQQRRSLLSAADSGAWPPSAVSAFNEIADLIGSLLGHNIPSEKRNVGLFIYDGDKIGLRPVLSRRSWTGAPLRADFVIPLGRGIAGAAFQQRRVIPWTRTVSPFIVSYPHQEEGEEPDDPPRTLLAIPIYHPSFANDEQPPPWACLGVLSFGSTSEASLIPRLLKPGTDAKADEHSKAARGFAHTAVDALLGALEGRKASVP